MPYQWLHMKDNAVAEGGAAKATYEVNDFLDWMVPIRERRGTSTSRMIVDTANTKFIEYRWDCGATSGDNRGIYNRLYLTGAGSGGESLRSFTTVEDVRAGTVHGAHISLNFGSTGSASGLAVAMRATLQLADQAYTALPGTFAAVQAEIWSDGSTTDPAGLTEISLIRCVLGGDATGLANVDDDAYFVVIDGNTIGSAKICEVAADESGYAWNLKAKVGGQIMYFMMADDRV